jgi:deoxyribodipyrimidine photo-lyase
MKYKKSILWFRNDLRLHDNQTLEAALKASERIIPVFCLNPKLFNSSEAGLTRIGEHRLIFLRESLENLKANLIKVGADLIFLKGEPHHALIRFALEENAEAIFYSEEVGTEEEKEELMLKKEALSRSIETTSIFQSTLIEIDQLPFPIKQLPEVFTAFRQKCEKHVQIRQPIPGAEKIPMAEINTKGFSIAQLIPLQGSGIFKGGETAAWARLNEYFWQKDLLRTYKETRNELLGMDYSSKFSPYLSMGCISAHAIAAEVKRYEQERIKNDSTYWLIFELLWRDYFKFVALKHGFKIFTPSGIIGKKVKKSHDPELFTKWQMGNTGIPFVDANMRELIHTGFMSNRGRQIVSSFLVNDLQLDWTLGAAYFESLLVDYDVSSNWCNWMYVAGVGNDPRSNRYFNILKQGENYDPAGDYVRTWVSELANIPGWNIHIPFQLSKERLNGLGISLGETYPSPVVKISRDFQTN